MVSEKLIQKWRNEERQPFAGWDFSYLKGRWIESQPTWDYVALARRLFENTTDTLDIGTGGGEILTSIISTLQSSGRVVATESYLPNVPIAKARLEPLGVEVVEVNNPKTLPFRDDEFDLVLNRHSAFDEREVYRVLKNNGTFLTQQISGGNVQDLLDTFSVKSQFKDWNANTERKKLEEAGFLVERDEDWEGTEEYKDVGALVYMLKAIPWVVKDFSVEKHLPVLEKLQEKLEGGEQLFFTQKRFLIQAKKP